jgi:hypothetical protein
MDSAHAATSRAVPGPVAPAYRSTRPYGRAAARAAPGPIADVHRTASANAPGWAPQERPRLSWTIRCCAGRYTPTSSGRAPASGPDTSTASGAHTGAGRPPLARAKLPAPRVTQPSPGHVVVRAERTDSAPTEPCSASRQMAGVSVGSTSSQRSPAAPATIT